MFEVIELSKKKYAMGGKKKRNAELALSVGRRISSLLNKGEKKKDFAKSIGISPSTLWDYMNGDSFPSLEVLLKIGETKDVTIDWLLKGEKSITPKNEKEKKHFYKYREAEQLKIAEGLDNFTDYLIIQAKSKKKDDLAMESETSEGD